MYKILLTLLACVALLTSCDESPYFPEASGRPYEVLVVMDTKTWKAPTGRALFDVLDTDVPMLPQSERSFRISQSNPQDFNRVLNIFRNIIIVNINDKEFTRTRIKYKMNKWARNQLVMTINSPSPSEFVVFCQEHKQEIIDFITKMEMNRLIVELRKQHSKRASELAKEIFDCELWAPKELASWKKGKDFMWVSNDAASGHMDIVVYSYPYEGPETFNKRYVCWKRDSVMEKNLPGERPGMYMTTDTLCTAVKPVVVHGKFAYEMRGLWVMKGDCMGGPFVSFSRVDEENNRVIVAEGFVYAPEKMKRGLSRRLEGALYTLKLPEEQYTVAITPELAAEEETEEETSKK